MAIFNNNIIYDERLIMNQHDFGVKGLVMKNGQFLLLAKPDGKYDLPGGRFNSEDPSIMHTLTREIYEETRITVKIIKTLSTWHFWKENRMIHGLTFLCLYFSGNIILSPEHYSYHWQELSNLQNINFTKPYGMKGDIHDRIQKKAQ